MDVQLDPRRDGSFATASLDATIKLWNFQSQTCNGTLKGHKAGVNCIAYSTGERRLLVSGGDDYKVIIWDLPARNVLRTFSNHDGNVTSVGFLEKAPFFVSLAEDGKANYYSMSNFSFSFDVINFMNKGWSLSIKNNYQALGYDEGCVVLQLGSDIPLASSRNGRLLYTVNGEVFGTNLKALILKTVENFQPIEFDTKEGRVLDIFPNEMSHGPKG